MNLRNKRTVIIPLCKSVTDHLIEYNCSATINASILLIELVKFLDLHEEIASFCLGVMLHVEGDDLESDLAERFFGNIVLVPLYGDLAG